MSDPAFQIWGIRAGDFEDSRQRWKERVKSLESFTKLRGRKEIALTYSPSASCIFYESAHTHTGEKHGEGMEFPSSRFRELNGRSLQIEPGDESFEFRPLSPFFSLSLTLDTMKLRISLGGRASRPKQLVGARLSTPKPHLLQSCEFSMKRLRHETRLCFRRKNRPTFEGRPLAFNQDYVLLVSNSPVKKNLFTFRPANVLIFPANLGRISKKISLSRGDTSEIG